MKVGCQWWEYVRDIEKCFSHKHRSAIVTLLSLKKEMSWNWKLNWPEYYAVFIDVATMSWTEVLFTKAKDIGSVFLPFLNFYVFVYFRCLFFSRCIFHLLKNIAKRRRQVVWQVQCSEKCPKKKIKMKKNKTKQNDKSQRTKLQLTLRKVVVKVFFRASTYSWLLIRIWSWLCNPDSLSRLIRFLIFSRRLRKLM